MTKIRDEAFAAVQQFDGGKPMLMPWSVASRARDVRAEVGRVYCMDDDDTPEEGWKRAQKDGGMRVVKIQILADI